MRTVYLNGEYLPEDQARVSIFDRGFLFADAVYEVTSVLNGKLIDFPGHCQRLRRSLRELEMSFPQADELLLEVHRELVKRNSLQQGLIYLQVTRGAADRDFLFPPQDTPNTVVLFTQEKELLQSPLAEKGLSIVTLDDLRWLRCDIKTVQLLYPSMAKMRAKALQADDAWLVKDGYVTEGTSNNAFIVTEDNCLVTRDLSNDILHGITRKAVLRCADQLGLTLEERPFSVDEAESAAEAFFTSAATFVMPVVMINGKVIGEGKPGPISRKLREVYIRAQLETAI